MHAHVPTEGDADHPILLSYAPYKTIWSRTMQKDLHVKKSIFVDDMLQIKPIFLGF